MKVIKNSWRIAIIFVVEYYLHGYSVKQTTGIITKTLKRV